MTHWIYRAKWFKDHSWGEIGGALPFLPGLWFCINFSPLPLFFAPAFLEEPSHLYWEWRQSAMCACSVSLTALFGSKLLSLGRGSRGERSRPDPRCLPFFSLCSSQSILTALFDSLFILSLLCPRTVDFPLVSSCHGKGLVRKAFTANNDPTGRTKRYSMLFRYASLRSSFSSFTHSSFVPDARSVARKDVACQVRAAVVDWLRSPPARFGSTVLGNPIQWIRHSGSSGFLCPLQGGQYRVGGTWTPSPEAIFAFG